jgi:hypothetical protein
MKRTRFIAYTVFMFAVAMACYLRPSPDDFDRYVYEAIVRSAKQPIEQIYPIVKHESPRAESSSVMDSPGHLAQLEPLYAIRPIYIEIADALSRAGLAPQSAINAISAASLFFIGMLVYQLTGNDLYSALLICTPNVVTLGRLGGPDALSSLVVVSGCMAVLRKQVFLGILLLMVSIWVRTDNVLICLSVLAWLCWRRELKPSHAALLGLLASASVEWINRLSGNYGWKVLLRYSFVSGRYPADITSGITFVQYVRVFLLNAESLVPQLAIWVFLGIVTWKLNSSERGLLTAVAIACGLHYALFPSGEDRYFAWACLISGILFVRVLLARMRKLPTAGGMVVHTAAA